MPLAIDELPLVALLGAFAEGTTIVHGAEELRRKESDRIATVVEGLRGLGARIEAAPDGFVVRGDGRAARRHASTRRATTGSRCWARSAGIASREGVEVEGFEAAAVSYPAFADDLRRRRCVESVRDDRHGRAPADAAGGLRAAAARSTAAGACSALGVGVVLLVAAGAGLLRARGRRRRGGGERGRRAA